MPLGDREAVAKLLLYIFGSLVGLSSAYYLYGISIPEVHQSQVKLHVERLPDEVWTVITDYEAMARWWPAIHETNKQETADCRILWWRTNANGERTPIETVFTDRPRRLVKVIGGKSLSFGGSWTFELLPQQEGGTEVVITEEAYVRYPLLRPLAKHFLELDSGLKDFAFHLEKHLE